MRFTGQFALDSAPFAPCPASLAYLCVTDADAYVPGAWLPDPGENAVVLQPGSCNGPLAALRQGPTLSGGSPRGWSGSHEEPSECAVTLIKESGAKTPRFNHGDAAPRVVGRSQHLDNNRPRVPSLLPTAGPAGMDACGGGFGPRHDRVTLLVRSVSGGQPKHPPACSRGEWSTRALIPKHSMKTHFAAATSGIATPSMSRRARSVVHQRSGNIQSIQTPAIGGHLCSSTPPSSPPAPLPQPGCGYIFLSEDGARLTHRAGYSPAGFRFIAPATAGTPRRRCPRPSIFLAAFSSRSRISPQFGQTWVRTERLCWMRAPQPEQSSGRIRGIDRFHSLPGACCLAREDGQEVAPSRRRESMC